jgi:hypothetical protein
MVTEAAVLATDLTSFSRENVWEFEVGSLFLFKPMQHEIHLNYVYKLRFCFTEDTLRLSYKVSRSNCLDKLCLL